MPLLDWLLGPRKVILIVAEGNIYSWGGGNLRRAGGSGYVVALEEHESQIYEGSIGGINKFTTLRNQHIGEMIRESPPVKSLCSHNGTLFHAISDENTHEIRKTFSSELVASRPGRILTLESHNGHLYDAGDYGLFKTLTNQKLSDRPCVHLCSHGGTLYGCNYATIYDALSSDKRNKITMRNTIMVHALCSHDGELFDADQHGSIWHTLNDTKVLDSSAFAHVTKYHVKQVAVTDMLSSTTALLK